MTEVKGAGVSRYNDACYKFEQAGRYGEVVVDPERTDGQFFKVRKRNFFGWVVSNVRFALNIGGHRENVLHARATVMNSLLGNDAVQGEHPQNSVNPGGGRGGTPANLEEDVFQSLGFDSVNTQNSEEVMEPGDDSQELRQDEVLDPDEVVVPVSEEGAPLSSDISVVARKPYEPETIISERDLQFIREQEEVRAGGQPETMTSEPENVAPQLMEKLRNVQNLTGKGGSYRKKALEALREHAPISMSGRKITTQKLFRLYSKSFFINGASVRKPVTVGNKKLAGPNQHQFVRGFEQGPILADHRRELEAYLKGDGTGELAKDPKKLQRAKDFALFLLSSDKLPRNNSVLFQWHAKDSGSGGAPLHYDFVGVNFNNSYFRERVEGFMRSDENSAVGQTASENRTAPPGTEREGGAEEVKTKKTRAEKSADRFLVREWEQFKKAQVG